MPLCRKTVAVDTIDHEAGSSSAHPYLGLWATADGYIRQNFLATGEYEEARGPRLAASRGRYAITGDRIEYVEDGSGFTSNGRFEGGVLHHAGMALYRQHPRRI